MSGPRAVVALGAICLAAVMAAPAWAGGGDRARHSLRAPVTDQNFYFVMADRFENGSTANDLGGLPADPLVSGFDPTRRGFYNGGDLEGLLERIDYIRGLGTTAIWLTPSFKNKAVQLEDGPSAGYHGYWITDFTQIDPHLGTNAELRALVDAAHARGMKVFFDIITNHTADVIGYQEGARRPYVSKDVEPYRTASGVPFDDRDYAGTGSFPPLDPAVSFPYTPVLDPAERNLKFPAWLNDVRLYHNRGDTTFVGENSYYGDFFGLDDLFTEHPRRGRRHDRDLQDVDPGHGHRRLPDRHDEARQRRVLAGVRARGPGIRAAPGQARLLHVRRGVRHHEVVHVALHHARRRAGGPRLPVPGRRPEVRERRSRPTRCATSSPATTGTPTPTRTCTSSRPSSGTTTWGGSARSSAATTRARRTQSWWRATASRMS